MPEPVPDPTRYHPPPVPNLDGMDDADLVIDHRLTIPASEISWSFSTTSGPGGQHANKVSTRVEARFEIAASRTLDEDQKRRLATRYGTTIRVSADETRSQHRNRRIALNKLGRAISSALEPRRRRVPTRATRSSQRARLTAKRQRSEVKRGRSGDWRGREG